MTDKKEAPVQVVIGGETHGFDDIQSLIAFLEEKKIYGTGQLQVRTEKDSNMEFLSLSIDLSPGPISIEQKLFDALATARKELASVSRMDGFVMKRGKLH